MILTFPFDEDELCTEVVELPPGKVVVSTTTSGWKTISWDEYWVDSSEMVEREFSEGVRG